VEVRGEVGDAESGEDYNPNLKLSTMLTRNRSEWEGHEQNTGCEKQYDFHS
jgi:hypothetical protein